MFGGLVGGKGYSEGHENNWMAHLKEDIYMSVVGKKNRKGCRYAAQKAGRWCRRVEEGAELFMWNWYDETERRKTAERRAKAAASPSTIGISKRSG